MNIIYKGTICLKLPFFVSSVRLELVAPRSRRKASSLRSSKRFRMLQSSGQHKSCLTIQWWSKRFGSNELCSSDVARMAFVSLGRWNFNERRSQHFLHRIEYLKRRIQAQILNDDNRYYCKFSRTVTLRQSSKVRHRRGASLGHERNFVDLMQKNKAVTQIQIKPDKAR
jgi:hypothetical protein